MRRNSTPAMGALHPILFFTLVYAISLFLAFFVCRTVYNSLNNDTASRPADNKLISTPALTATVYK